MPTCSGSRLLFVFLLLSTTVAAQESAVRDDLLAQGESAWLEFASSGWTFENGRLRGETALLNGAKTDPAASMFLLSRKTFTGNFAVVMDITFDAGRYVGVYVDFDQDSQSGIWMASGHVLPDEEKIHHVESGYIKTVDHGHWVVRTTGELPVKTGQKVRLEFRRNANNYSLWRNGRMVASYHKQGAYPSGKLQLRLTNARATISHLEVVSK